MSLRHLQGKHAEAEAFFLRAIGIQEKVPGPDHLDVATTLNNLAKMLYKQVTPVFFATLCVFRHSGSINA